MGLGLKHKAHHVLNAIKSKLRIGDYWYWLRESDAPAEIPIGPLVYPLRYDILIRKSFFDFYAENQALFRRDPEAFIDLAQEHDYYKWFTKVLMVRYEQTSLLDPQATRKLFSDRVRRAAALHDSISSEGFNSNYPIIPFTGEKILPTDQGTTSSELYYMGDGCHRLACLMSQGYKSLPRNFVRIKCFRQLSPFDNTTILAEHLPVNWPEFPEGTPDKDAP